MRTPADLADTRLPENATGQQIFLMGARPPRPDGEGLRKACRIRVRDGERPGFPDFNDARLTLGTLPTGLRHPPWGPVRALDRKMPASARASSEQIELAVRYLWTFCTDPSWPRGDLNLPRAFFTEKAFPENEAVWTMGITGAGAKAIGNEIVYEHRIGSRTQYEVKVPIDARQGEAGGAWRRVLGDVESAVKRAFYHNSTGSIFAAAGRSYRQGKESWGSARLYCLRTLASGPLPRHEGSRSTQDTRSRQTIPRQNEGFVRAALVTCSPDQALGARGPDDGRIFAKPGTETRSGTSCAGAVSLIKLQHTPSMGLAQPLPNGGRTAASYVRFVGLVRRRVFSLEVSTKTLRSATQNTTERPREPRSRRSKARRNSDVNPGVCVCAGCAASRYASRGASAEGPQAAPAQSRPSDLSLFSHSENC